MGNNDRKHTMLASDFFAWQSQTADVEPFMGDDELAEDVDEPPELQPMRFEREPAAFQKAVVRPQSGRTESLLTRQFSQAPTTETTKPDIRIATHLSRRRSCMSIASAASTAELTSDGGGITSPARTSTPSPPYPNGIYMNLIPYQIGLKQTPASSSPAVEEVPKKIDSVLAPATIETSKQDPAAEAPQRRRCISFACGPPKPKPAAQAPSAIAVSKSSPPTVKVEVEPVRPEPVKRSTTIKFSCPMKPAATTSSKVESIEITAKPAPAPVDETTPTNAVAIASPVKKQRGHSRSPSWTRKLKQTPPGLKQRDSSTALGRCSNSPNAVRKAHKPTYVAVSEEDLMPSEANRFHEFASDEPQQDDWITKDKSETKARLTINDTLMKENAIRRLGEEAEEEALEEEDEDEEDEDDEEEEEEDGHDIDQVSDEEDEELEAEDNDAATSELQSIFSKGEVSDGNETDNEAGFADSDDESDGGDFSFWTPGRTIPLTDIGRFHSSAHRTASESSIDSLRHMSPVARMKGDTAKRLRTRKLKIRPGTPDLPDSTDFVCGTLDEDRPAESAYISCMEQRRREKQHIIPQDIDPSFPTSDPENDDEDNDDQDLDKDSEGEAWIHGKFEDSDDSRSRRSTTRKAPKYSPKRLHSPPPQKRLRSPAPLRKMHSPPSTKRFASPPPSKSRNRSPPPPKRILSPPPQRMRNRSPAPARRLFDGESREEAKRNDTPSSMQPVRSPPGSLVQPVAISFVPLGGNRPGLTHTKSLPRTPSAFCKGYRAARLVAVNGNIADGGDGFDGHKRGAIDIKRGIQQKNERRSEKVYRQHCNRARKAQQAERRPMPGRGAERMRQRGLQMAGKTDAANKKAQYVLSI